MKIESIRTASALAAPLALVWAAAASGELAPWAIVAAAVGWILVTPLPPMIRWIGVVAVVGAVTAAPADSRAPSRPFEGHVRGRIVERRRDPAAGELQVRLRLFGRPDGTSSCVRGKVAEDGVPPLGSMVWARLGRVRDDGGSCPWSALVLEPADERLSKESTVTEHGDLAARLRRVWTAGELPPSAGRGGGVLDRLRASGLGHILAISGLHIGMLMGFASLLIGLPLPWLPWRLLRRDRGGALAACVLVGGLSVAAAFVIAIGAPASAVRALGVASLTILARRWLGHAPAPGEAIVAFVLVTTLVDATALATLGLELSLTAIAWLTPLPEIPRRLRTPLGACLPWIGTAPGLAAVAPVPLAAPFVNLLGLPLFGLWVFPAAAVAAIAERLGLAMLFAVADDAYRWGLATLDRLAALGIRIVPEVLMPPVWPAEVRLLWAIAPILATRAWMARRRPADQNSGRNATGPAPCTADSEDLAPGGVPR